VEEKPEALVGNSLHNKHPPITPANLTPLTPMRIERFFASRQKFEGIHSDEEIFWRADGTSFPVEYCAYPPARRDKWSGAVVTLRASTGARGRKKPCAWPMSRAESWQPRKMIPANMSPEILTPDERHYRVPAGARTHLTT